MGCKPSIHLVEGHSVRAVTYWATEAIFKIESPFVIIYINIVKLPQRSTFGKDWTIVIQYAQQPLRTVNIVPLSEVNSGLFSSIVLTSGISMESSISSSSSNTASSSTLPPYFSALTSWFSKIFVSAQKKIRIFSYQ